MVEFFQTILGYIEIAWQFFTNYIEALGTAFSILASSLALPTVLESAFPGIIGASVAIAAAIGCVKMFAGLLGGHG